jgi:hypothetical protein
MLVVLRDVGCVDHDEEVVGLDSVDDEVVHDAALGVARHRVHGAAVVELAHLVGDQPLHRLGRAGAAKMDLAHVAHVEHADCRARGLVLVENPRRIVDRHEPPAEVDHLGPQPAVRLAERGGAGFGRGVHRGGILAESVRGDKRITYLRSSSVGSRNPTSSSLA